LPVHHPAATVTYLLKDYGVFNELEGLHRPSESTDFFAPHLSSFWGRFDQSFLALSKNFFIFFSDEAIDSCIAF
jgi:hypothetical protein